MVLHTANRASHIPGCGAYSIDLRRNETLMACLADRCFVRPFRSNYRDLLYSLKDCTSNTSVAYHILDRRLQCMESPDW